MGEGKTTDGCAGPRISDSEATESVQHLPFDPVADAENLVELILNCRYMQSATRSLSHDGRPRRT